MKMIDCNVTENFLREKARMAKERDLTCFSCPLYNNKRCCSCKSGEETAATIAIVQRWSDAHPQRTYLSVLLEAFPNVPLSKYGTPSFCPSAIGFANRKECCDGDIPCPDCWAQELRE